MQKRAFERLSTKLEARFFWGNTVYPGVVTNLSEKGMFVNTKACLPVNSVFAIALLADGKVLTLPANVKRSVKRDDFNDWDNKNGMGVELLNSYPNYSEFVSNLIRTKE